MEPDGESPESETSDKTGGSGRGRHAFKVVALLVVAVFATGVWLVYMEGVSQNVSIAPPLVRAPAGPVKIKPREPGGLKVPNQDKQVFQALNGGEKEPTEELLLPPSEQPAPDPDQRLDMATAAAPAEEPIRVAPSVQTPATQTSDQGAGLKPPAMKFPATDPALPQKDKVAAPQNAKTALLVPPGAYLIQLASYRSAAAASSGWQAIAAKHRSVLRGLSEHVQRIDLGAGKGVYYRLQAGTFAGLDAAKAACARLKAKKQGCLVVRR